MKLGRVQSRHDPRTLQLTTYLTSFSVPPPPAQELLETISSWPMLANDRFNCCTSAAAGHMVHHWTAANHRAVMLQEEDIIRAHALLTGDRLMDCVTMLNALKFWRCTGIGHHRIHSFIKAHPGDASQVRSVIHLFGSAYIGLDLPRFACSGEPHGWPEIAWTIPPGIGAEDAAPQPDNGHCVTAIGYSAEGLYVVTWGRLKIMSWEFFARYNVEAYAILSKDWVDGNHAGPSGFDLSTLERDLVLLEQS